MTFADLHELLRLELLRRIESGLLTGTRLAQQTGFRQAHISNFLNRKRSLSLEGLDRVLHAQDLTIDQILPLTPGNASSARRSVGAGPDLLRQSQQQGRAMQAHSSGDQYQVQSLHRLAAVASDLSEVLPEEDLACTVPLVSPSVAMTHPRIAPAAVLESLPIAPGRLGDPNPRIRSVRQLWQRFVAIRVDAQQAAAMAPMLTTGAAAVLDRHATSPVTATRSAEPPIFAVRSGAALLLRLVELDDDRLILRPASSATPVQLLPVSQENPPADFLIGRVVLLITSL